MIKMDRNTTRATATMTIFRKVPRASGTTGPAVVSRLATTFKPETFFAESFTAIVSVPSCAEAPHFEQNLTPGSKGLPQPTQYFFACSGCGGFVHCVPQEVQNA